MTFHHLKWRWQNYCYADLLYTNLYLCCTRSLPFQDRVVSMNLCQMLTKGSLDFDLTPPMLESSHPMRLLYSFYRCISTCNRIFGGHDWCR